MRCHWLRYHFLLATRERRLLGSLVLHLPLIHWNNVVWWFKWRHAWRWRRLTINNDNLNTIYVYWMYFVRIVKFIFSFLIVVRSDLCDIKVQRICMKKWKKKILYCSEFFFYLNNNKKLLMWYKKGKKLEYFKVDCF
jgi:hypothetical protein